MPCVVQDNWADGFVQEDCHDDADGIGHDDDRQQEQIMAEALHRWLGLKVNDEVADQQHRLQLLDAAAGVRDDDLRLARYGDGGQMVVDVDLTQLEHPNGQGGRYESERIGDHQNELFPHGDEQAENNECGR